MRNFFIMGTMCNDAICLTAKLPQNRILGCLPSRDPASREAIVSKFLVGYVVKRWRKEVGSCTEKASRMLATLDRDR
jgi:hypothetical protein